MELITSRLCDDIDGSRFLGSAPSRSRRVALRKKVLILAFVHVLACLLASAAWASLLGPDSQTGLSESEFTASAAEFRARVQSFAPRRGPHRLPILVTLDWPKPFSATSAGGSSYFGPHGEWAVHIAGWVARYPSMTSDAIQLIYCHELGHKVISLEDEDGADNFAVRRCLPVIWQSTYSSARVLAAAHVVTSMRNWMFEETGAITPEIRAVFACRQRIYEDAAARRPYRDCQNE